MQSSREKYDMQVVKHTYTHTVRPCANHNLGQAIVPSLLAASYSDVGSSLEAQFQERLLAPHLRWGVRLNACQLAQAGILNAVAGAQGLQQLSCTAICCTPLPVCQLLQA